MGTQIINQLNYNEIGGKSQMIKCEFGKETHISGHVVQIAAELEMIMRDVRCAMCESLGESKGM